MRVPSLQISASALTAERTRLDVISQNIANANTTRTESGGPYRRQMVTFEAVVSETAGGQGVRVGQVAESSDPPQRVYDPGHPDADAQGYVLLPNVNIVDEMVDLLAATRAYEANTAAAGATKSLVAKALEIGR